MNPTATNHRPTTSGRRRVPAVIALATAAGVALSACSADPDGEPVAPPATTSSTFGAGTAMTTRSTGSPIALIEGTVGRPSIVSASGCTTWSVPR